VVIVPNTKKLLVAFDPAKPDSQSSDFIIPWNREGQPVFLGLKSSKDCTYGLMVFVGRAVSENDLFAKLVDSGAFIENVEDTLACLRNYVTQLQSLKIGNVVRIIPSDAESSNAFGLELVAQTPSGIKA
jgi:hypothetical protein